MMNQNHIPLVEARAITKHFMMRPGLIAKILTRADNIVVRAVDDVNLKIWAGETVAWSARADAARRRWARPESFVRANGGASPL